MFKLKHEFKIFVLFFKYKHILMIIVLKSLVQDCYKIVYDKRNTTHLPPEKTTSVKSKDEDNG